VGNTYYISVDNFGASYRGSFTLCMDNTVDYDFYEGAIEITDITGWCSPNAAYTTVGATPDGIAGSCWNASPNFNRWFKFKASGTEKIVITVLRGGGYGNIRAINMALWQADGLTQVACNRYSSSIDENVTIQKSGLTEDNWYYISVDNFGSSYRGSFSLCIDDGRMRWIGAVDNNWANPGNWAGGFIPTSLDDVLIPQGLSNYPETNSGSDAQAKSLKLEPATRLTIPSGKALTIVNNFELQSDASGVASLIDKGTLNYNPLKSSYQSFISKDQWHLVASPVANAKSGIYKNLYLKYFTEPDSSWHYIISLTHNLLAGEGFATWAATALTGDTTVTYKGQFNTGDKIPPALSYNVGPGMGDGWNLIGNPYPSAIEWNNNWNTNNLDASIYVYDGTLGQYLNWNKNLNSGTMPNGDIPPGQGFWVKANGSSPSVTIPDSERKHTSTPFYKVGVPEMLGINAYGNNMEDKMLIHFVKTATEGFDSEFDAYKLMGVYEAPQAYMEIPNAKLALNALPIVPEYKIPIGFEVGEEGIYNLTLNYTQSITGFKIVYLEDKRDNIAIDLLKESKYSFNAAPSDSPKRFNLHLVRKSPDISNLKVGDGDEPYIYSFGNEVFVALPENLSGEIQVYDLMGRIIARKAGQSSTLNILGLQVKSGIYVVKVIGNQTAYSEKVFIQ
jgi:hypothetical protein